MFQPHPTDRRRCRSASRSRSLSKSTLRPRSFSMMTITKPNLQRTCAAKYPASETKRAVRVLDRSSKGLGRGRLGARPLRSPDGFGLNKSRGAGLSLTRYQNRPAPSGPVVCNRGYFALTGCPARKLIRIFVLGLRAAHRIALIYGFTQAHKARMHRFAIGSAARESLRKYPGHGREQERRIQHSRQSPRQSSLLAATLPRRLSAAGHHPRTTPGAR